MVTEDGERRHVPRRGDDQPARRRVQLSDCWLLDDAHGAGLVCDRHDAVTGAPYGGVRLYGLWPHNGKTVAAYLVGLDCGSRGRTDGTPDHHGFHVSERIDLRSVRRRRIAGLRRRAVHPGAGDAVRRGGIAADGGRLSVHLGRPDRAARAPQESGSRIGPALGDDAAHRQVSPRSSMAA
jgi:hypothetical protein